MLVKTIVFLSIGVLGFLLFGGFGTRRVPTAAARQPKNETLTETPRPVSPRVFRSLFSTPQESLKHFQKSDFYRTIVDNNLFRPLGWTPPRPRDPYRLLGTIIPTDANTPKQAILQRTTARTTNIVTVGDKLDADTTVTDIQAKQVTLETVGQQRTLRLNTTPFLK
ncbi:MAG: hypothetical protein OXI94_17055 [Gemmatimonadota bacterium]|nr:hypothetical protein [Candidatus Poribacteria bacterium]MDE2800376.1 hypothetical protein [Gemmatimonadota bacterium]